jgi:hypothetical protein
MNTTEVVLHEAKDGQSFLEANQSIVEQCAVQALMELMNSNTAPDIKLSASIAALKAVGRAEPRQTQQSNTTNIQINAAIAGEAGKALAGLAETLRLMGGSLTTDDPNRANAPQNIPLTAESE